MSNMAKGVTPTTAITEPYVMDVLCIWRDSTRNFDHSSIVRRFEGVDRETVLDYVIYYAGHNGMVDFKLLNEDANEEQEA